MQAVGRDGLRVRATMFPRFDGADWALAGALPHDADIEIGEGGATVRNGHIRCEITPLGQMRFYKDDTPVLCEYYRMYCYDSPHTPSLRVVAREFTPSAAATIGSSPASRRTRAKSCSAWGSTSSPGSM